MHSLDSEVAGRLVDELGEDGCRAVEFLTTAHALLSDERPAAPRWGQAAAYCMREAMTAVAAAGGRGEDEAWTSVSTDVVDAAARYRAAELHPSDAESALRDLLTRIERLRLFHEQRQGRHRRQLHDVMFSVTGDAGGSVAAGSMDAYQDLLGRLNGAVHSNTADVEAEDLWQECLETLQRLFLPPQTRFPELERLAQTECPTETDRDAVVNLVASPEHLRRFLDAVVSPTWLRLLSETGHLDPPDAPGGWPAHQAVCRLADSHPDEVVAWLEEMACRHVSKPLQARSIASAAAFAGPAAAGVVLSILEAYPQRRDIVFKGLRAVRQLPATDARVEAFADIILNETNWSRSTLSHPLLDQLADGVTDANARRRIELLCYKIRAAPGNGPDRLSFRLRAAGSVADLARRRRSDRTAALLSCLLEIFAKSFEWLRTDELLAIAQLLPESLNQRLRAWILAHIPQPEPDLCIEEINTAIASRNPTGDDLALVDRVVSEFEPSRYTQRWQTALGDAPSIDQVGEALHTSDVPSHWRRSTRWASLLPSEARGQWATPTQVLSSLYGSTRRQLQLQQEASVFEVRAPFSDQELLDVDPAQAAALIAGWRPAPGDWPGRASQLCGTLESVVNRDPDRWLAAPVSIVTILRHPRYISRYLHAVASQASERELPVGELLDALALIRRRPWPAEPITADSPGETDEWREAEIEAMLLIRALVKSRCAFNGRSDEAWAILEAESTNCPPRSQAVDDSAWDSYESARDRSCTQALETALVLLGNEHQDRGEVHPAAVRMLDTSLRLAGRDGTEHRAVLAVSIGFLRHVLGDWTASNHGLLFGPDAPEGLAQSMIDQALKWGQPNEWLLESRRDMVHDAVRRNIERALEHVIVAMLWEVPGYSIAEVISFIGQSAELMSDAGETLGRLLAEGVAEQRFADNAMSFWQAALDHVATMGSEAGDALFGFGWLAEVEAIDTEEWEEMTLRTLKATGGRIDRMHGIGDRLVASPPTANSLAIFDELVRGHGAEWDREDAAEQANPHLESAEHLQGTVHYRRLRAALMERGQLD